MPDEVLELSVRETNKLRAQLGLAPLRGVLSAEQQQPPQQPPQQQPQQQQPPATTRTNQDKKDEQVLELSVEETNNLRAKLGLKPLRQEGESSSKIIHHVPAQNQGDATKLQERLERQRLERQVQQGIAATFGNETLGQGLENDAVSWALKMRSEASETNNMTATPPANQAAPRKKKKGTVPNYYDEQDLEGMNVAHSSADFEAGSTTVLTLADTPLLKTQSELSSKIVGLNDDDKQQRLENTSLADQQLQRDRLRQKRQVELGMGRAGGYAGFDDDEFEELGGVQGPNRSARGMPLEKDAKHKRRGFQIGGVNHTEDDTEGGDLFAHQSGKAISLVPAQADVTASDFYTAEEDEAMQESKKNKRDAKFKTKKKKKEKKKSKRKTEIEDEDDEDEQELDEPKGSILDELEETSRNVATKTRKRRRNDDEENDEMEQRVGTKATNAAVEAATIEEEAAKRRARFNEIMEKGNQRTAAIFKPHETKTASKTDEDEEPDDSFLSEALAKARRLRKLRKMADKPKGADAVAQALQSANLSADQPMSSGDAVQFTIDDTEEFTRALRARAEQAERQREKKVIKIEKIKTKVKMEEDMPKVEDVAMDDADETDNPKDIAELAKQIDQDVGGIDGTANAASLGRGMAGVLSMLRHTGDISGRNAGREEMRGRAKDERTYDDYEPLNLAKVVRIGPNATEKDREFASREIKLDYRDEHGRLLTRKEAYRNICYQFHGHGSGTRNQEKRLRQIEREQAEARVASQQASGAGSLGALKATQKATGKAFVVHKT